MITPRITLNIAAMRDNLFNLNVLANAKPIHTRAQIDKTMVPYNGIILLKSPMALKKGSSKAVNPKRAKVKFVFL